MADLYIGPSRLDLLVLIHNFNIVEEHKAKIVITETVVDPNERVLIRARTARSQRPKNHTQKDIDKSFKQLWNFKKHVDGFKELRDKDWEMIVRATNTLRFLVPYCRGKSMEKVPLKVKTEQTNHAVTNVESKGSDNVKQEAIHHRAVNYCNITPKNRQQGKSDNKFEKPGHETKLDPAPGFKDQPVKAEDCRLAKKIPETTKGSVTFSKETRAQVRNPATPASGQNSKHKIPRKTPKDVDKLKTRSTAKVQERKAVEAYQLAKRLASEVRKF